MKEYMYSSTLALYTLCMLRYRYRCRYLYSVSHTQHSTPSTQYFTFNTEYINEGAGCSCRSRPQVD